MIDAAVYVLDVFDWRRAGRPRELVRVEGRDLFTRPGGGVSIRAEARADELTLILGRKNRIKAR